MPPWTQSSATRSKCFWLAGKEEPIASRPRWLSDSLMVLKKPSRQQEEFFYGKLWVSQRLFHHFKWLPFYFLLTILFYYNSLSGICSQLLKTKAVTIATLAKCLSLGTGLAKPYMLSFMCPIIRIWLNADKRLVLNISNGSWKITLTFKKGEKKMASRFGHRRKKTVISKLYEFLRLSIKENGSVYLSKNWSYKPEDLLKLPMNEWNTLHSDIFLMPVVGWSTTIEYKYFLSCLTSLRTTGFYLKIHRVKK